MEFKELNPVPLVEAKEDIREHAKLFRMDEFVRLAEGTKPDEIVFEICGTVFCIAGSMVIRYFGAVLDRYGDPHPATASNKRDSDSDDKWDDDWAGHAASVAGMSHEEADSLFYRWNWERIDPRFRNLDPTPENACVVIDEFLSQKGYDPDGKRLPV